MAPFIGFDTIWRKSEGGTKFTPFVLGCVSKVESMTAERKNLQNQKEIRAECRIFLYTK